jgi:hypothetical protein
MRAREFLKWPVLAALAVPLLFAGNAWAAFSISSASWSSSSHTLTVSGSGAASRATVTIKYTGDPTVIGTTTASSRGSWSFSKTNPSPVPCNVRAESGNSFATRSVSHHPANCSDNGGGGGGGKSINSTSQNCGQSGQPACRSTPVTEQPAPVGNNSSNPASGTGLTGYQIVGVNDLGMHCGDLDTRVLSILPPYNVLNVRVFKKPTTTGGAPTPLTDADAQVYYSAGSSATDPALGATNPLGFSAPTGSVFKSNF